MKVLAVILGIFSLSIETLAAQSKADTDLATVVSGGTYKDVEEQLSLGGNPNIKINGTTALIKAFRELRYGYKIPETLRIIDLLLSRGGDPSILEDYGWSCAYFLVDSMDDDHPELEALLKRIAPRSPGLTTIYRDQKGTILHLAALKDLTRGTNTLLDMGVPVDIPNDQGESPLDFAIKNHSLQSAKVLLNRGASVFRQDVHGRTPLHLACIKGSSNMVKLLVSAGANPDARMKNELTPLGLALYCGKVQAAEYLLTLGVQTSFQGTQESLAMLMAVCDDPPNDESWISLWKRVLNFEKNIDRVNDKNESLVLLICENPKARSLLPAALERHPDVNLRASDGRTALMAAVDKKDKTTVELLMAAGASIHQKDNKGVSALDRAKALTGTYGREIEKALSGYPWVILPPLPLGGGAVLGKKPGFFTEMDAHFIDLRFTGFPGENFGWKTELTVSTLPVLGLGTGLVFGILGGPYGLVYGYYIPGIMAVNYVEMNVGLGLEKPSNGGLTFYGPVYLGIRIPVINDKDDWYKNFTLKAGWQSSFQNWSNGQFIVGLHLGAIVANF